MVLQIKTSVSLHLMLRSRDTFEPVSYELELGGDRSGTSSRVASCGFVCRSRAFSRVEGCENTGYGLPGTQHYSCSKIIHII